MKKISILCGLILSMALVLVGCTSGDAAAGDPAPGGVTEPSVAPNENEAETSQPTDTFMLDYEDVSITGDEGTLSLKIPVGWVCEACPIGSDALVTGEYGFHIYPEGVTEGSVEVGYVKSFGVCGTGLEEKEMTLAGEQALVGTYDNQENWSFISFREKNIVALTNSAADWFPEYEHQLLDILDTLEFDKANADARAQEEATEICGYPRAEDMQG